MKNAFGRECQSKVPFTVIREPVAICDGIPDDSAS